MEQVSNLKKVRTLQNANPKLTEREACLLLGIKQDDLEKEKLEEVEIPDFIKTMFDGKVK